MTEDAHHTENRATGEAGLLVPGWEILQMKIDLYTKAVLTVIACSLCIIALRGTGPVSQAHAAFYTGQYAIPPSGPDATHVIIDGVSASAIPLPVKLDDNNSIHPVYVYEAR